MTLYRDIIKRVLAISWRYKYLWFFGFFATALGTASDIGLLINSIDDLTSQTESSGTLQSLLIVKAWLTAFVSIPSLPPSSFLLMLAMFIFFAAIVWIVFVSVAGIIGGVAEIEKGKRQTFNNIWKIGNNFWAPIFGVNLAAKIIAIVLLIIGLPFLKIGIADGQKWGAAVFLIYFGIIFLPLIFIASIITKYAMINIVVKKKPFDQAIISAFNIFKANWIVSIEMVLVIFAMYILAAIVYVIAAGILTFALQVFALVGYLIIPSVWWHISITILAMLLYAIMLFILGAITAVIEYASWTKLFLKLDEGKVTAKIFRLAGFLPKSLK